MSKTKHPGNMVFLTESEHFVHFVSALIVSAKTLRCVLSKRN